MKANVDAWWPHVEAGAEAIVVTASGCGTTVKDYGRLLRDDPAYAAQAARIAELSRDVSEVVAASARSSRRCSASAARPRGAAARGVPVALQPAARPQAERRRRGRSCATRGMRSRRWPTRTSAAARRAPTRSCSPISRGACAATRSARSNPATRSSSPPPTSAAWPHVGAGTALPVVHWIELIDQRLRQVAGSESSIRAVGKDVGADRAAAAQRRRA